MPYHLSTDEIQLFTNSGLAPDDLLRVDAHLDACEQCRAAARATAAVGAPTVISFAGELSDLSHREPEHVSCENLAAYVDRTLAEPQREWLETHVSFCQVCARELEDLQSLRTQLVFSPVAAVGPAATDDRRWWKRNVLTLPVRNTWAATAVCFLLAGLVTFSLSRQAEFQHKQRVATPPIPGTGREYSVPKPVKVASGGSERDFGVARYQPHIEENPLHHGLSTFSEPASKIDSAASSAASSPPAAPAPRVASYKSQDESAVTAVPKNPIREQLEDFRGVWIERERTDHDNTTPSVFRFAITQSKDIVTVDIFHQMPDGSYSEEPQESGSGPIAGNTVQFSTVEADTAGGSPVASVNWILILSKDQHLLSFTRLRKLLPGGSDTTLDGESLNSATNGSGTRLPDAGGASAKGVADRTT